MFINAYLVKKLSLAVQAIWYINIKTLPEIDGYKL